MISTRAVMIALGALCLLMVAAVAGAQQQDASWTYLYGPAHRGNTDPISAPLVLQWKFSTGVARPAVSTPAVGTDRVFFAIGQHVYAVDRQTGAELWKLDMGTNVHSSLVLDNGILYLGADDNKLWAIDAESGDKKWRINAGAKVKSTPLIHRGYLYFGADDGYLYAVDIATQEVAWRYKTAGAIRVSPAIYKDKLFVASQDGYLHALLYEGHRSVVWTAPLASPNVFCSPMVERNQVIVGAGDRLVSYNVNNGSKRWQFSAEGINALITGTPAAGDRSVFVGSRNGHIYEIRLADGQPVWWYPDTEAGGEVLSAPVVAGSLLLCRMGQTSVVGIQLDRQTSGSVAHKLVWNYNLATPPAVMYTTTGAPGAYGPGGGVPGGPGMGAAPGARPMMGPGAAGMPGGGPGGGQTPGQGRPGTGGAGQPGAGPGVGTEVSLVQYIFQYEEAVDAGAVGAGSNVYVLGDDGALYGFAAREADNIGPQIGAPQMTMEVSQQPITYALWSEPADTFLPVPDEDDLIQIPGAPPLRISFKVTDEGCGVDPNTVKVLIDGQAVDEEQFEYVGKDGVVWYKFEQTTGAAEPLLANGLRTLVVAATDWSGNSAAQRLFFVVDNSLAMPKLPGQPEGTGWPGWGAGGQQPGMPGGPMRPGGGPGGRGPGMGPPTPPF